LRIRAGRYRENLRKVSGPCSCALPHDTSIFPQYTYHMHVLFEALVELTGEIGDSEIGG
jgi:hypothetical protein